MLGIQDSYRVGSNHETATIVVVICGGGTVISICGRHGRRGKKKKMHRLRIVWLLS